MTARYEITWWTDMGDDRTKVTAKANSFDEALEILPHGPKGWERYLIEQGKRFVERGDPFGPRGVPAKERGWQPPVR